MRSVPKALRRSARLPRKLKTGSSRPSESERPKQKFSIDWKFPVDFVKLPTMHIIVTALRDDDGVWTAKNADGKVVAFFGDNFAKHLARQIYAYGPGETPKRVFTVREQRIQKSGSIAARKKAEPRTDDWRTFEDTEY